jgi:hypothetical protein
LIASTRKTAPVEEEERRLSLRGYELSALLDALCGATIRGADAPRVTQLLEKLAAAKGVTLEELGLLDGGHPSDGSAAEGAAKKEAKTWS